MIIQEQIDNKVIRTYSDKGVCIQGGFPEGLYDEAIDPIEAHREYVETNIPIENKSTDEEYIEAAKILLGEENAK